jgi:hypothetical protein
MKEYANLEELREKVIEANGLLCVGYDRCSERSDGAIGTVQVADAYDVGETALTPLGFLGRIYADGRIILDP